jgi:predicted enzyme related to lactoylglutathione lyase
MPRVVHFEISANEPEQQARFYGSVFGWEITKWEGPQDYWLIKTGEPGTPGIDGGFFRPTETFVATVNTIEVDDIDGYVAKVLAAGGTTATDKSVIPGLGYLIYCKDPEGTLFGLHQPDPGAGMPPA